MTGELGTDLTEETIFTWGAPPLKFGAGAVDEIGFEMAQFGARRVLIITDPSHTVVGRVVGVIVPPQVCAAADPGTVAPWPDPTSSP